MEQNEEKAKAEKEQKVVKSKTSLRLRTFHLQQGDFVVQARPVVLQPLFAGAKTSTVNERSSVLPMSILNLSTAVIVLTIDHQAVSARSPSDHYCPGIQAPETCSISRKGGWEEGTQGGKIVNGVLFG